MSPNKLPANDSNTRTTTLTGSRVVDTIAFWTLLTFMVLTSRRLAVYWRPPAQVPPRVESPTAEEPAKPTLDLSSNRE